MFLLDFNCETSGIITMVSRIISLLRYAVPILLIALVTIDFAKAIMTSDEKNMEKVKHDSPKRVIYAVIIFLAPSLLRLVFKLLGVSSILNCYNALFK